LTADQPPVEVLLVSDKGGELWAMSLPDLGKKVRLFGHTGSVITDTLVTKIASSSPSSHLSILTADRDEKIRITEFPTTHTIQSYLLGHRDVITTLALHQPSPHSSSSSSSETMKSSGGFILSAGWDHQLCLWNKSELSLSDSIQLKQDTKSTVGDSSAAGEETEVQVEGEDEENGGEGEGEGDNHFEVINVGDDENRPFDASQAGSFPMRIIPSSTLFPSQQKHLSLSPIAIICWQSSELKIFVLEEVSSADSPSQVVQGRFRRSSAQSMEPELPTQTRIPLPVPPIDCLWFTHQNQLKLIVLLPAPHCLQIYSLQLDVADECCFRCELLPLTAFAGINTINEYIQANGLTSPPTCL
jgi:hypothetical protein